MFDETSVKQLRDFIGQTAGSFAPCLEPLSPKCLCEVHWQLTEAAKHLEPLSDDEMGKRDGVVQARFSLTAQGLPEFDNVV